MNVHHSIIIPYIIVPVVVLCVTGCGKKQVGPVERSWGRMEGLEDIVGNMADVSYSSGRNQEPRTNALDQPVHMTDFEGRFVWSEYAAPWCKPCSWQAKEMKKVEQATQDDIVFLTIMTSQSQEYNDHATTATAKSWASKHNLAKERVIAANLWAKTIPEHRFYSPEGHTLFVHVGTLTAEQVLEVIAFYKKGYEAWKETGTPAEWMTTP